MLLRIEGSITGIGVVSSEFSLLILCSSLVTLHPLHYRMAGERILLLIILMMPTGAWRRSQSTIFKKSTEVVITRSKWVITLMIDLKSYHDLLERLASEIEKVRVIGDEIATDHYSDRYRGSSSCNYQWQSADFSRLQSLHLSLAHVRAQLDMLFL